MTSPTDTLRVRFFRHGESAANAGLPSDDPAAIPLTDLGMAQAVEIAAGIGAAPDLIITSPFLRARQTAAPTIARFAGIPVFSLDIQEFTYLSPARCAGTTVHQRRPWADAYWQAEDPQRVEGEDAESFSLFHRRVIGALAQLAGHRQLGRRDILVFGHGQFLQATRLFIAGQLSEVDGPTMRRFRRIDLGTPIANGQGFAALHDGTGWRLG
ncbi:histidine phosphatase family protein [Azoarcus sp. TTM-91]|uniref:histidine phosphatase family protein n=1 Tax=Azoarcus sp. TTM-91 TaxID=2691581 RepID=UPI00145D949A|nr:histidine phosphatase family protein [Azoarcus sp. TTM-91]NMG35650.1 histidine phosphatase family protein [Azoarcus sp. TTM-91]